MPAKARARLMYSYKKYSPQKEKEKFKLIQLK